jgi:predicted nucleic acid-binding Zn ribbon protein
MSERKRKNRDPLTSSQVLQSLLEDGKSELSEQFLRWKLWKKWPEIVGETISQNSEPMSFFNGTLYVWVKSSTWSHHLSFMVEELKQKLNDQAGERWVRRIQFTTDRGSVPMPQNSTRSSGVPFSDNSDD